MINMIGEATGQESIHVHSIGSRVEILKQGESLRTEGGADEPTKNRTKLEGGKIIIETYTEDGKLVKITPPGYLPFDKIV